MTYPEWPLSLPHAQMEGDGSGPMFRDPVETEMEGGDLRRRRRPGDDVMRLRFSFRFTAEQANAWASFVRDDLYFGTARFLMPVAIDGMPCDTRIMQMIGAPNFDGRSGSLRMYSFEAWVFPADMVPFGRLDFAYPAHSQYIPLCF